MLNPVLNPVFCSETAAIGLMSCFRNQELTPKASHKKRLNIDFTPLMGIISTLRLLVVNEIMLLTKMIHLYPLSGKFSTNWYNIFKAPLESNAVALTTIRSLRRWC